MNENYGETFPLQMAHEVGILTAFEKVAGTD